MPGLKNSQFQPPHDDAIIEWPAEFQRGRRVPDRHQRRQIGPDGQTVLAGQFREVRIGEGWIVARSVRCDPVSQRAIERGVAPASDAGILVGGQIGRSEAAERRIDELSTGERPGRVGGMATGTIAGVGQRLAAGDILGRGLGLAFAADQRRAHQHASQNRPHGSMSPHFPTSRDVITRYRGRRARHAVACQSVPTTQNETGRGDCRHEIAIFERAAPSPRFVVRPAKNPT